MDQQRPFLSLLLLFLLVLTACNPAAPTRPARPTRLSAPPPTQPADTDTPLFPTAPPAATAVPNPTPMPLPDCDQTLCFNQTVSLLALQNRPVPDNVVKLFSAAADPDRNLVYVSGIMSQYIAVLDGTTEAWVDTIDSGVPVGALKYLYLDPAANYLYIFNAASAQLSRIDLNSGDMAGPVPLGERFVAHFALVDTGRTRLYLTAGTEPGFRAFDGRTLEQVAATNEMGLDTGSMAFNAAHDEIYVLGSFSQETQRRIYVLDPDSGQVMDEIVYDYPYPGRVGYLFADPAGEFLLVGGSRQVIQLDRRGETLGSFAWQGQGVVQDMLYDPEAQTLHLLSLERPSAGQVAAMGGALQAYDLNGRVTTQLNFGRKIHQLALNPANGRLYIPNGDASTVWSVDAGAYAEAVPLSLGDSVEGIVFSPDGRTLFVNSRLGGSYLAAYNLDSGAFERFEAGFWPIPIRAGSDNRRLIVLNAWESALMVYDIENGRQQALGTISLDLPPGSTDRLPDLAIDSTHHLAYAAYPEFGQVAVANWETMASVTTITVPDFKSGDTGGGPGQLQVAVNETANRLFVYRATEKTVDVYDGGAGYARTGQVSLPQMREVATTADMLFFDPGRNALFVGPLELDGDTGQPTGRVLPQGQQVFGLDEARDLLWTFAEDGAGGMTLAALDRDSLGVRFAESVPVIPSYLPHFTLSPAGDKIAIGYLITGTVDLYLIGSLP